MFCFFCSGNIQSTSQKMLVSLFCETEISFGLLWFLFFFFFSYNFFLFLPLKIHPYAGSHLKRTETCLIFCWSQSINQPIALLMFWWFMQVLKTRLSFTYFFKVFFYKTSLNCLPLQELHVSTPKPHLHIHASSLTFLNPFVWFVVISTHALHKRGV